MGNKVFVGGLAWATTDESLRRAFESCGDVADAKVVTERETGRSRGFGFVTFGDPETCRAALEQMNGAMLDGRELRVSEANESPAREGGGGGRGPRGDGGGGGGPRGGGGGGGGPRGGGGGERW